MNLSMSGLRLYFAAIVIFAIINMGFLHNQVLQQHEANFENTLVPTPTNTNAKVETDSKSDSKSLPGMIWLISYPNSGTSYTMNLVEQSTQRTVATNYGQEPRKSGQDVKPLYMHSSPEGPFIHNTTLAIPSSPYIMTKTHCSGYCSECSLRKYVVNKNKFLQSCSECNDNGVLTSYANNVVASKIIRLVRNPLDNVVSNFHHWRKKQIRTNKTALTDDVLGFKQYCKVENEKYNALPMDQKRPKMIKLEALFQGIPCHQSFFRYLQWHNNAERISKPQLIVYYDDYEKRFDKTSKEIFDFLEMDVVLPMPRFVPGKTYEFFTEEERMAVWKLAEKMALPGFREKIERYADSYR